MKKKTKKRKEVIKYFKEKKQLDDRLEYLINKKDIK